LGVTRTSEKPLMECLSLVFIPRNVSRLSREKIGWRLRAQDARPSAGAGFASSLASLGKSRTKHP
jgi:hypothetical protein